MIPAERNDIDHALCAAVPVIRGDTRMSVSIVPGSLAAGTTIDPVQRNTTWPEQIWVKLRWARGNYRVPVVNH